MQVFETTEGIDVFANDAWSITIKQESAVGNDPEFVVVPIAKVSALCKALRAVTREIKAERKSQ
jgi:hypothetical protein